MARQVPTINLQTPHEVGRADLEQAISDMADRPSLIGGEYPGRFERHLAEYLGVREVVSVASGTDALLLALRALGVGKDDGVITIPATWGPAGQAIRRAGASPLFVDIDLISGCMDVDALIQMLQFKCICEDDGRVVHLETGLRVAALLPIHLYGLPADMASILRTASYYQLPILEDACQAYGARCRIGGRWQRVGSIGAAAALSFSASETMGSEAEAGAVVTSDRELASKLRWLNGRGESEPFGDAGAQEGRVRLDLRQAALLSMRLERLDDLNRRRRLAAARYREVLAGLPLSLPVEPKFAEHVYHRYVVRAPDRDVLRTELAREGISAALQHSFPIHVKEKVEQFGHANAQLPAAERWASSTISFPMYPNLPPSQISSIGAACRKILGTYARTRRAPHVDW